MPCYHPLKADYRYGNSAAGIKRSVVVLKSDAKRWALTLPCGKCHGCRLEKSRQWAIRCMHEASLYVDNCFITLTYDDANLPSDGSLHYSHFQRFMKYLRAEYPFQRIRFYMAGEYGSQTGRPHYHAILFNFTFNDLVFHSLSPTGNPLCRSATLERLWPHGFSSVGAATYESAAYVARYIMKKLDGPQLRSYVGVNTETGEVCERYPEFNRMSLKPGIGAEWFRKFFSDVFPHDRVITNGTPSKVPRYYDKLLEASDSELLALIKDKRIVEAEMRAFDNTQARLSVKEAVSKAAISSFKRGFI
jgi:hypothetical protein